jgi:alkanesulfonate monooxygenase SsuD/methylene tetrahydromethanopterin reductase-like flavin-dependent oxidoreductase (luciferase family)
MKLATFMMPLHPPGRQASQTLAEDREAILLADKLGYVEAYVGEHVTDLAENVTSCLMFLASVAHETKNIVLGSGTINMPNSHPAAIAAQVAMLDHMLKGRFIMGISPGGLMSDAEVFGNFQKDATRSSWNRSTWFLDIWKGQGPYDLKGQFFEVTTGKTMIPEIGQGTILKPYQQPHPPIVVTAVAPHSRGVTEGGEAGLAADLGEFLLPDMGRDALDETRRRASPMRSRRTGASQNPSSSPTTTRSPRATATRPKGRTTSISSS